MVRFSVITALLLSATPCLAKLNCSATSFISLLPQGATLNYANFIPANGTWGDGNVGYPNNATNLPELCVVSINIPTPSNTSYNVGIFLPTRWNNKYLATGHGGFAGGTNWQQMGVYSQWGFAVVSTDTGHVSRTIDGSWAFQQPEKVINWGYRALHGSVELGKTLVSAYYSEDASYSYYVGCSTGGRQGLKEIQDFPDDFDGALVGAPAWWTTHLQTWTTWVGKLNLPSTLPGHIPNELFPVLSAEVFKQCDIQDGLLDGIVEDPYGCNLHLETLLCTPTSTASCFTPAQLDTVYKLYSDWVDVNQTFVFPGYSKTSESGWAALVGGTAPNPLGTGFIQYFLDQGQDWDWTTMDYSYVQLADRVRPGNANADNFDLSPFKAGGGKVIQYHGLSDNLIPASSSRYFYSQVEQTLKTKGVELDDFYRLFFVPNMGHCSTSLNDAPWWFTTPDQPKTANNEYGALMALMDWVENDTAPELLTTTKFENDNNAAAVIRERPVCPHPKQAVYNGVGNVNETQSWTCSLPWTIQKQP